MSLLIKSQQVGREYRPGGVLSAPQFHCVLHARVQLSEVKGEAEGAVLQTQLFSLRISKADRH